MASCLHCHLVKRLPVASPGKCDPQQWYNSNCSGCSASRDRGKNLDPADQGDCRIPQRLQSLSLIRKPYRAARWSWNGPSGGWRRQVGNALSLPLRHMQPDCSSLATGLVA